MDSLEKEITRRTFIKGAAAGAASVAAMRMMGPLTVASAEGTADAAAPQVTASLGGKSKFSGVHAVRKVSDDLIYLGVSDRRIALFENVYPIPRRILQLLPAAGRQDRPV